jgi:hypothetical protein
VSSDGSSNHLMFSSLNDIYINPIEPGPVKLENYHSSLFINIYLPFANSYIRLQEIKRTAR